MALPLTLRKNFGPNLEPASDVFDPRDIPFLPYWPDEPASQRAESNRWGSAKCAKNFSRRCKES